MVEKKPRRKLLYPVGLISLSILPFLCFFYWNQQQLKKESAHAMEVFFWSPNNKEMRSPLSYVNDRFAKITFMGTEDDKIRLGYAQLAIRELINQKDTALGIEFTFKDRAKYSSLVRLFDICAIEEARSYMSCGDKLWVFNLHPTIKSASIPAADLVCGTSRYTRVVNNSDWKVLPDLAWLSKNKPILFSASILSFLFLVGLASKKIAYARDCKGG